MLFFKIVRVLCIISLVICFILLVIFFFGMSISFIVFQAGGMVPAQWITLYTIFFSIAPTVVFANRIVIIVAGLMVIFSIRHSTKMLDSFRNKDSRMSKRILEQRLAMRKMAFGLLFFVLTIFPVVSGMIANIVVSNIAPFVGQSFTLSVLDIWMRILSSYMLPFFAALVFWPFSLPPALLCVFSDKESYAKPLALDQVMDDDDDTDTRTDMSMYEPSPATIGDGKELQEVNEQQMEPGTPTTPATPSADQPFVSPV